MQRPQPDEYAPFYETYVRHVTETDIVAALTTQLDEVLGVLRKVTEAESLVLHAPYTWTFKEVVGHLIDGERIFGYRALRFARADATPLPGFEENDYARAGEFNRVPWAELLLEFEAVRRSQLFFWRHLPDDAWGRGGKANNSFVTVRALAFIMCGHVRHHFAILRRRLLNRV